MIFNDLSQTFDAESGIGRSVAFRDSKLENLPNQSEVNVDGAIAESVVFSLSAKCENVALADFI